MRDTKKRKRTILTLRGVRGADLMLAHYGTDTTGEDDIEETEIFLDAEESANTQDLLHSSAKSVIYFLDPHKVEQKMWIHMFDEGQNTILPRFTKKPCWWCRHSFSWHPVGCPLSYSPHISSGEKKKIIEERMKELNLSADTNDFFSTEGIFCSFPCVQAYIVSKKYNTRYKKSATLLTLLYLKIFGKIISIPAAPTWKIIDTALGHLSIEEYRETYGKLRYIETSNIRRPYMYVASRYIQEIQSKDTIET